MMLIYVTICDSAGRDASVLLDASRITAVAPYAELSPNPFFTGLSDSRRPRNRSYLDIRVGMDKWVVPVSEWPRIKAALVRLNGGGFNRFDNDAEGLECPHFLQTPTTGAAAREEAADTALHTTDITAIGRETFSADAVRIAGGIDWGREAAACSSSR